MSSLEEIRSFLIPVKTTIAITYHEGFRGFRRPITIPITHAEALNKYDPFATVGTYGCINQASEYLWYEDNR